ncbi:MAG: hypothetical protein ACJ74U_15270 [Jatrophihabitantaceae bacterium]
MTAPVLLVVPATGLLATAAATTPGHLTVKSATSQPPGTYQPLNPTRIFDTRTSHPIAPRAIARMRIQGAAGLPAAGISAVTVTLSVLNPAATGSISVFPSGTTWPGAATVSFAAASTQQNTVTAQLGSDGALSVRNNTAAALQLVADVVGYYTAGPAVPGGYQPVPLQRLYDTRAAGSQPLAAGRGVSVPVTGRGAIPASNVSAGAVNVTVLSPTGTGSATVFPYPTDLDRTTTVSFTAGQTEQTMLTAQLDSGGTFWVRNNTGTALQLVIDIAGYYVAGSPPAAGGYVPLIRDRILDSRSSGDPQGPFTSGQLRTVPTLGTNINMNYRGPETPHWGVRAETILLGVVSPSRSGSISVFAGDRTFDGKATISFTAGRTVLRLVTVRIPPEGTIRIRNNSSVPLSVIADVHGYFAGEQNRLHLAATAAISARVGDVSCTSASFCMALTDSGYSVRYDGSSWSAGSSSHAAQNAVSCVSPTFCAGVGGGAVSTYDGSQWSEPILVTPNDELTAVSCASASFCVAMSRNHGWAYVFNGTGWDSGTDLNPQAAASAVSCPTSTFCMAWADGWYRWNGSSWSGTSSSAGANPVSVSCVSSTFCQYVTAGYSAVWNGTSWLSARAPVNHPLSGVSCPAAFACIVGDEREVSGWDGAEWSMPITSSTTRGSVQLRVSCPTVDFCMAVDYQTAYRLDS